VVAAALLSVVGFTWLFGGTALGFLASAGLVLSVGSVRMRATDLFGRPGYR
jgi:hypothetical protein